MTVICTKMIVSLHRLYENPCNRKQEELTRVSFQPHKYVCKLLRSIFAIEVFFRIKILLIVKDHNYVVGCFKDHSKTIPLNVFFWLRIMIG